MLGRELVQAFSDEEVAAWDKEEIDITKEDEVRKKIVGEGVDLIVNVAADTDVDGAELHRERAFAVNEIGVKNVAMAAKDMEARMVHFSTDYVFPGDREDGYEENDPPGPAINVYGESKLAGERALIEVGPEFYLIRTAWLYGQGGKNFVDTMLKLSETNEELKVVNDQEGSPTYAVDLAAATRELMMGKYDPGIYHQVNAGQTSRYDLAREIFKQAGIEIQVEPVSSQEFERLAKRPAFSRLNNTKGPLLRDWREALGEYINIKIQMTKSK